MLNLTAKYTHSLFFLLLFLAICLFYQYPEIFTFSPRSTHQWRQCDSASIALNYAQNGMQLFHPQLHYELNGGGYCAAGGEMPIPAYLAAIFYKLLNPHEGYFRLINLFFLLLGLWAFSRMLLLMDLGLSIALLLPGLIFTAPVLAYYGFNFVPNAPALGLVLLAWYYFYRYRKSSLLKHLILSMGIFALAGLFKISALLSLFALIGIYMLEFFGMGTYGNSRQKLFPKRGLAFALLILPILAALLWKGWADHYNALHQTSYFAAKIKPIWSLSATQQLNIFNYILDFWLPSYFHYSVHLIIILLSFLLLFKIKTLSPILKVLFPLLFGGVLLYGLLWFKRFSDHDYYAIDLLVYPIFILTASVLYLKKNKPSVLSHPLFQVSLLIFFLFNLHHARSILQERYAPDSLHMEHFNPSFYKQEALHHFLDSLDIHYPTKVISFPDESPNNSLYHLNLRGWSGLYLSGGLPAERVHEFIRQGAEYLIINKVGWLKNEELQPFFQKEIGKFDNSIYVFDLRGM